MNEELRDKLKSDRLRDYQAQMFILKMDIAALEAIGDAENAELCKQSLDMIEKSYKAVEAL